MSNHAPEQVEAVAKDARFAGFETYADMLYGYAALLRENENLVEEVREAADLRERMGTILTEVADVLKGPRPAGGLHSWHDLYAVAAHVVAERNAVQSRIAMAPVAIIDTRDVLGLCAPAEEDFPALYAMQGQRVALVKLPPERDTHA